jgi:hypothetical protein
MEVERVEHLAVDTQSLLGEFLQKVKKLEEIKVQMFLLLKEGKNNG